MRRQQFRIYTWLNAQHLAPERWRPGRKAPEICPLQRNATQIVDLRLALSQMPTLLRSYLSMRGWVSDHAVVDRDLNTLHVFTGVEVAAIPPARKRLPRAIAG